MDCPSTGGWGWLWPGSNQTGSGAGPASDTAEYLEATKTNTDVKIFKSAPMSAMQHQNYSSVPNFNNTFNGVSSSNEGAHLQIVKYEVSSDSEALSTSCTAKKNGGDLGKKTVKTAKEAELEKRREANRLREKRRRELMTPEERQKERLKNRLRARDRRLEEKYDYEFPTDQSYAWMVAATDEEKKRTERDRIARRLGEKRRREQRSLEERERARERHRIQERERRRNLSELEREEMRIKNRERAKQRRAEMTPEEKEKWRERRKNQERKRRAMAEKT